MTLIEFNLLYETARTIGCRLNIIRLNGDIQQVFGLIRGHKGRHKVICKAANGAFPHVPFSDVAVTDRPFAQLSERIPVMPPGDTLHFIPLPRGPMPAVDASGNRGVGHFRLRQIVDRIASKGVGGAYTDRGDLCDALINLSIRLNTLEMRTTDDGR